MASAPQPSPPLAPPAEASATTVAPRNHLRALWATVVLLTALLLASLWLHPGATPRRITQDDIDAAVLRTLENTTLPSPAAAAVEAVAPSVVRVVGYMRSKNGRTETERGIGTGVVIVDSGVILTNLHVVQGASRITVTFHDGLETTASITGVQPENDLAVLQAHKVPDDLAAAPLRSTQDLRAGDQVVAIGFPFGIGPSASAGVVSGLDREFDPPEGSRPLTNLHVVQGASRITITFHDGLETTASVTGVQPENDLAVLQAHKVPDDLAAAPLRSTQDLRAGDQVVAIGFPFGIGPSASAGVVSGLDREFDPPEGTRPLTNLIQFDAAANPGNSGGPLVTMEGEVVGIVTAILNPTEARTFIGIGFAVPIENAAAAVGMPPF